MVTAWLLGAGDERRRLGKGGVELLEAPPQRAGDLPHRDGAAVLGQRHLEVRAAHVVAGCNGHGTSAGFPASRAVLHEGRAEASEAMDVIPVIDVRHGRGGGRGARAARRLPAAGDAAGRRAAIRPTSPAATPRCLPFRCSTSPISTASRGGDATPAWRTSSQRAVPNTRLWIDDGTPAREAAPAHRREGRTRRSSSAPKALAAPDDVAALRALPRDRYVLSLDFKGDRFAGPGRRCSTRRSTGRRRSSS